MAVSINNKNGTTTKVATNVKIIKQPANHFMTKAAYDPNGEVAQAGGIPEYVDSQVSEISEVLNIHEERRNIFDYTDVTDNKYRASTLGSSINDTVDNAKFLTTKASASIYLKTYSAEKVKLQSYSWQSDREITLTSDEKYYAIGLRYNDARQLQADNHVTADFVTLLDALSIEFT